MEVKGIQKSVVPPVCHLMTKKDQEYVVLEIRDLLKNARDKSASKLVTNLYKKGIVSIKI